MAAELANNFLISYLMAVMVVIISFSVNLYRVSIARFNSNNETIFQTLSVAYNVFLAVLQMEELDNLFFSMVLLLAHVMIMFLNNYNGQKLMTTSVEVFHATYNSLWYRIPPKSQKLLLFVLMKSQTEVKFNLSNLYVPCFEGFATMMSSSFSYFTVIYSVQ